MSKVLELATHENVVVVHPIAIETTICRTDPSTDEIISIRKSPKHGTVYNLFDEMVRASSLIGAEHVTIDVILVRIREIRTRDGRGSWRRNGDSTVSRELIEVVETRRFESREDWIQLLPQSSLAPEGAWDSLSLAAALGIAPARARKLLYSFRRANILADAGKAGNRKLYRVLPANQSPS